MPRSATSRPLPLVWAIAATWGLTAFFVVMAVLSWSASHGGFSAGVAAALLLWAILIGVAAWLLGRGIGWARGPVVAAGLLHVFAFGQFVVNGAPWALLGAAAGLVTVVGCVLPASTAWLSGGR